MTLIRKLCRNQEGATIVETAFALPILIIMIWAIVQLGLMFRAMSGIQHALGEGARYATLYPQPSDAAIKAKMTGAVLGIKPGTFVINDPVAGVDGGSNYLDLTVDYTQPTDLLLLPGPTIHVTRSKRVWVAS